MSIPETITFDKDGQALPGGFRGKGRALLQRLFVPMVIILVALLSFGIGRLSATKGGGEIRLEYDPALANPAAALQSTKERPAPLEAQLSNGVVASKTGSKYHYPSCPGAKQIKEANKITFPTPQAAEAAGYSLAANCKAP